MILRGDARHLPLTDRSVQCVVTSPPYWGLRDYGLPPLVWDGEAGCEHEWGQEGVSSQRLRNGEGSDTAKQAFPVTLHSPTGTACLRCSAWRGSLGLEPTPEWYVAHLVEVMREVWRVLRDDGTLWLNLGDSYASSPAGNKTWNHGAIFDGRDMSGHHTARRSSTVTSGLKPKDLVGIPWMVAKALQAPYYTGRIKNETDRAWLAAFIESEGTITYVERDRGEDHTPTHDIRVFVTNCDRGPMDEFAAMTAGHVYQHEDGARDNRHGERPCYRWQMGTHDSALLLREVYPYLRMKRKQAALVWTLYTTLRHKNGHARTPADVVEKRRAIADSVRALNRGESVDLPSWVEEPPHCSEPGWYLRSDIIWSKPNPMPESVTDRPTKAHEYLFLLAKSERYYYDAEAIKEPSIRAGDIPGGGRWDNPDTSRISFYRPENGSKPVSENRNRRSVWGIATQPYPEAHFATFPEDLVKPCVLAGCPVGGIVLDPFAGSGTVVKVAQDLGRRGIGVDLSTKYMPMAWKRAAQLGLLV